MSSHERLYSTIWTAIWLILIPSLFILSVLDIFR